MSACSHLESVVCGLNLFCEFCKFGNLILSHLKLPDQTIQRLFARVYAFDL